MQLVRQWRLANVGFISILPLLAGVLVGSIAYYASYQNKKALQQSNLEENVRLIKSQLKSFDLAGLENFGRVISQADYITGISIRTRNDYPAFERHKNNSGDEREYFFTSEGSDGSEKFIGSLHIRINHDPELLTNLLLFMFTGGSLGLFFAWPFSNAKKLKRQLEERTASERAISEREENLRITLDSIADAVIVTDTDGLITRMNPVAETLTGWKFSSAKRQPLNRIYHTINQLTRAPLENPAELVLKSGSPVDLGEGRVLVSRQEREYHIAESAAPIVQFNDQISGVVIVFRDVTEEILMQRKMREMEKMQAIGVLVGGLAHDYNNLLAIISGAAEVIEIKDKLILSPSSKKLLASIVHTSKRGSDLTAKLLAFSSGNSVDQINFPIHQAIDNVVGIMRQTIDKRFEIITRLEAGSHHIAGNPSMIENALLNIGLNASQARNGDSGRLVISTESLELAANDPLVKIYHAPVGPCIQITLRDDGVGIPEDLVGRIFEPFFSRRKNSGGFGLGLSAVYATVTDHGGAIMVESEVGAGTAFTVFLPLGERDEVVAEPSDKPLEQMNEVILVVDDEEGIRQTLSEMLELIGYHVLLAAGGAEAIRIFEQQHAKIDGIIMDMNMPEMSGQEAISGIWQIDETCPVVISTGYAETTDFNIKELRKTYNISYIKKPYSLSALNAVLAGCLHKDGLKTRRQIGPGGPVETSQ